MKRFLSVLVLFFLAFGLSLSHQAPQAQHRAVPTTVKNADGTLTTYFLIDPNYTLLAGDGYIEVDTAAAWDTVHDATAGDGAYYAGVILNVKSVHVADTPTYKIARVFLPVDTSTLTGVTVTAATFYFYVQGLVDEDNDAQAYVRLVGPTTQPSTTQLTTGDFDLCSTVNTPTLVSDKLDLTGLSGWQNMPLTDLTVITQGGVTMLGMREGHDIEDSAPTGSGLARSSLTIWSSTGTYPCYLSVTYADPGPTMAITVGGTPYANASTYAYGTKLLNTNTDVEFTITNNGDTNNLNLTDLPIVLTGTNADQFSVTAQATTPITPTAHVHFTIRFTPTSSGAKTAAISIANNDTAHNPYVINFTGTGHAPTDWYVRPAGGTYGAENGTSYADAWDGLVNVVWGTSGVMASDTLWICGMHIRQWTTYAPTYSNTCFYTVGASGTAGNPITIRGDSPSEAGEIWGFGLLEYEAWVDEGSGAYSITNRVGANGDWCVQDPGVGGTLVNLTKVASLAACQALAGSFYCSDYTSNGVKFYVHCTDGLAPTNRIAYEQCGYILNCNARSYITFRNIGIYGDYYFFLAWIDPEYTTFFTLDGVKHWYGMTIGAKRNTNHDWVIKNCDIAYMKNGFYLTNDTTSPYNVLLQNNHVHHIGYWTNTYDSDAHCMGVQGGDNIIVERNEFDHGGTGFTHWSGSSFAVTNLIIRKNFVHDMHTNGGANGRGIELNTDSATGPFTNIQVNDNIVANIPDSGFRFKFGTVTTFYNNTAYACKYSFYTLQNTGANGMKMTLRNNISMNPVTAHIYFLDNLHAAGTGATNCYLDSDYNLFYPDTGTLFYFCDSGGAHTVNFTNWKALSHTGCVYDPHSPTPASPAFINAGGSYALATDFQIPEGSPARNAGVSVGLTTDFWGNTVPIGVAPDIGVHEFGGTPEMDTTYSGTPISDGGTYAFGSKNVGTSTDVTFLITNSGDGPLTITTPVTITGVNANQFSIPTQPTSPVAASGTTTLVVRFSPTSSGAKTAAIAITNSDTNENPYDLTVTGTGVAAAIPKRSILVIWNDK